MKQPAVYILASKPNGTAGLALSLADRTYVIEGRRIECVMVTFLKKRAFWVAVGVAGAVEGVAVYQQWPSPPVKVCASVELGELLAASARVDAQLRDLRIRLRTDPNPDTTQQLMRLEAESAKALNAVANFKKRAQEQQKASGGACS